MKLLIVLFAFSFLIPITTFASEGKSIGEAIKRPDTDRQTIIQVQNKLYGLGLVESSPNGRLDVETVRGINAFQKQKGLPATGQLDASTLEAMGVRARQEIRDQRYSE